MSTEPPPDYGAVPEYEVAVCRWLVRLTLAGGVAAMAVALATRGDDGDGWFANHPLTQALIGGWFLGLGLNMALRGPAWAEYWRWFTGPATTPSTGYSPPRTGWTDVLGGVTALFGLLMLIQGIRAGL